MNPFQHHGREALYRRASSRRAEQESAILTDVARSQEDLAFLQKKLDSEVVDAAASSSAEKQMLIALNRKVGDHDDSELCKQHAAPRAFNTCSTCNFFSCARG